MIKKITGSSRGDTKKWYAGTYTINFYFFQIDIYVLQPRSEFTGKWFRAGESLEIKTNQEKTDEMGD